MPEPGDKIDVWFSCGAASAVAAKLTLARFGNIADVRILNNPIAEEDEDNRRFLRDCEEWFGQKIIPVVNPEFPKHSCQEVWLDRSYMSGIEGAPCTWKLKKAARQHWESVDPAQWAVLGFTADEKKRHENFVLTERSTLLPVLIDAGLSKEDCFEMVKGAGIDLPRMYLLGYPNANCPGCVKATSPTYWNHVRKHHPKVFWKRASLSRVLGVRLVRFKGERIYLDELPPDAVGRPMKSMKMPECGLYCEEKIIA